MRTDRLMRGVEVIPCSWMFVCSVTEYLAKSCYMYVGCSIRLCDDLRKHVSRPHVTSTYA